MANSTVLSIDPNFLLLDTYSVSDENLISNQEITSTFNPETDYIDYYIYGLDNSLLTNTSGDSQNVYTNYSLVDNNVFIDPSDDLTSYGYEEGSYNVLYNFYSSRLASNGFNTYFISEISSDRTELRLDSNDIEDTDIISSVTEFIAERTADEYYPDFLLNFGLNRTVIANNIALDGNTVLIKLYEPLPQQFGLKSTLWVVEEVAESIAFNVSFESKILEVEDTSIPLRGPNINLSFKDEVNNSTESTSLAELDSSPLTGSYQQLQSLFNNKGIRINTDYTEFANFINFSTAKSRITNFEYKLQLIESYRDSAQSGSNVQGTQAVSGSKTYYENLIEDTIKNFDGYEYFLYYTSGSKSWPKANSEPPFKNLATTDASAISWFSSSIASASLYDESNQDNLFYNIPEFLRNDSLNQGYIDFVEMIGQHFDNIWIYLNDVTNKYNADNRIDAGISKDLVAQTLRDFSLKIYQNNFSSNDIYSSFLGLTPSGSLFPFPNITGSLPTPEGFEYINTFISSSDDAIPLDDINKRIYKRLYHNLPYLFKSKGTIAGIKTLLNTYGVPDTILRISEFGGKDKVNTNDYDYWYNKFNYGFVISSSRYLEVPFELNPLWGSDDNRPQTFQFRFKTPESIQIAHDSQSLVISDGSDPFAIVLEYDTSKATTSGSFSGSILDSNYQYADLKFYPNLNDTNTFAKVNLPFANNDWWGIQITRAGDDFELTAADKIYNGQTGTELGFIASASVNADSSNWSGATTSWFSSPNGQGLTNNYRPFNGYFQEIRYYNTVISESVFKDYVMNPLSFEGNSIASGSLDKAPDELAFRATLGGELYTGSTSIHPKVTGSWVTTSSFSSDSNFTIEEGVFEENREYLFFDQPAVGVKNRINDKIRSVDLSLPTYNTIEGASIPDANTLSNQQSIQQDKTREDIYTNNVNLLEVTFSPQNELNDDIISQLGYFNMGDLIGDPREISSSAQSYPELDKLRQDYFLKYVHENYDFNDYVRLIKFFDNSLFKMIKDFVPARTSLASGITIKPHILERQKYPVPQAQWEDRQYTGSIKPFSRDYVTGSLQVVSGGTGGSLEKYNKPVTHFRVVDTSVPITAITSTPTILLNQGTINISLPEKNGVGLIENISNGKFRNITGYDVVGDIKVEIRNNAAQETFLLELVENDSVTVAAEEKSVPQVSTPNVNSFILKNCLLKANQEYHFQLSTTTAPAQIIGVVRAYFIQDDAPEVYRVGQMYSISNTTPLGSVTETIVSQDEFYNGEFSGSALLVEDGELNPDNPVKYQDNRKIEYQVTGSNAGSNATSGKIVWNGGSRNINPGGFALLEYYCSKLFISEVSDNEIFMGNALSNLSPGDDITLTIRYGENRFGNITYYNKTITQTIEDISAVNSTMWRIKFNDTTATALFNNSNGGTLVYQPIDSEVILNPLLNTSNFENSDFNATIGNATDIRLGTLYQDIDYSSTTTTPVNFNALLSGSATKAAVPDSNYSTKRIIIPRYDGSRSTSNDFNLNSNVGGLGSLPNVEQDRAYFAYFNWVGGTSPLWGNGLADRSALSIRYFVDSEGNVLEPTNDSKDVNLSIVRQTFTEGETAVLSFDDENGTSAQFQNLVGNQVIFKSGKSITPIVYSQTQSISNTTPGGYTSSLEFVQGDQNPSTGVGDYRATIFNNGTTDALYSGTGTVKFSNQVVLGASASFSSNQYSPIVTNPSAENVTINLEAVLSSSFNPDIEVTYQLFKGSTAIGNPVTIDYSSFNNVRLTATDASSTTSDTYELKITNFIDNSGGGFANVTLDDTSFFKVNQNPLPNIGNATENYWTQSAGLDSNQIRTDSLTSFYGQKQRDLEDSGFFPIVNDFVVQPGDEIRFEGTEVEAYKVITVGASGNHVVLTLDRDVTATNLNWFLLRRYIDTPGEIIIEADKAAGGTSPGFFMPLYATKGIEDNFDTITQKLKTDQLI